MREVNWPTIAYYMLRSTDPIRALSAHSATAALVVGTMLATACSRAPVPEQATRKAPYLALHLAYEDSATGRQRLRHGDSAIYVVRDPILSDDDFAAVRLQARGTGLLLQVTCHPRACTRLATVTGENVGSHLAVLVGSQVRGLAPIASAVGTGGSVMIAVEASGPDSERIATDVRSRWPTR
jgi:hypothetical protein